MTRPAGGIVRSAVLGRRTHLGNWAVLLLICALSPRALSPTLTGNEQIYIPQLLRQSRPALLAGDWTFGRLPPDRLLFGVLFRPLTAVGSWWLLVWVGRVSGWILLSAAVVWFLDGLGVRSATAVAAVGFAWLANGLSFVTGEWVVGTFESKTLAYACLFAMLRCLGDRRVALAGLLAGLAFSLHSVVGLWTVLILVVAVAVAVRPPAMALLRGAALLAVAASPSLPSLAGYVGKGSGNAAADTRLVVRNVMPFHLDPFQWGHRSLTVLVALFVAGRVLAAVQRPRGAGAAVPAPAWRVLAAAEWATAAAFAAGFVLRALSLDPLLLLMPCRVATVVVPVGALARACDAVRILRAARHGAGGAAPNDRPRVRGAQAAAAAGVVIVVGCAVLANGTTPAQRLRDRNDLNRSHPDDTRQAYGWARRHLPDGAVVAASPGRKEVFGTLQRAVVASVTAVPLDDLAPWRLRVEDLSGVPLGSSAGFALYYRVEQGFLQQPFAAVERWRQRYAITHVITSADYPLPVLFRSGDVRVYEVGPPVVPFS